MPIDLPVATSRVVAMRLFMRLCLVFQVDLKKGHMVTVDQLDSVIFNHSFCFTNKPKEKRLPPSQIFLITHSIGNYILECVSVCVCVCVCVCVRERERESERVKEKKRNVRVMDEGREKLL